MPKPKPNDAQPERKPDVEPAPAPEPEIQTDPALHPWARPQRDARGDPPGAGDAGRGRPAAQ